MKKKNTYGIRGILCLLLLQATVTVFAQTDPLKPLPKWQEGYLDIHFINTGCGNSSFLILPDGTTMLIDAGDKDPDAFAKIAPWKVAKPYPDNTRSAAQWIINYMKQVAPANKPLEIDYAMITHFHGDHYGVITKRSKQSAHGDYLLSGITEIGDSIPIHHFTDRGYPGYNFPADLTTKSGEENESLSNYIRFIKWQQAHTHLLVTPLQPGATDQITLVHQPAQYPGFQVRGIKANAQIWSGQGKEVTTLFTADSVLKAKGSFTENALSLAIKLSYGKFNFYAGGDNTGLQGYGWPAWADVETPIAKVVGQVEALTLHHHGTRDGTNDFFLRTLQPQVIVQQSWRTDHPGQEVLYRLLTDMYKGPKDIFATNIQEETKVTYGNTITKGYKSLFGHVLIRVLPGGDQFYVYVLQNDGVQIKVSQQYGPYFSK